jgi:lipooligosaccharide transport system permease protein
MKSHSLPTPTETVFAIWSRNFLQFRKTWMVSLFWIVLEPVFVLGAMGYGLGSYVPQVEGMSYLEFFFPALLCNSTMMVAFFEGTYANFTKLSYSKLYHSMLLAPMDPARILSGEVLWGATKALFSAAGVILVAAALGALTSARILLALPVIFLSSLIFATFGMLVTSRVKNYDQIIYPSSGLIVPLSLFSGTYFPLSALPKPLQVLSYLSPLTHAVSAVRSLQQGQLSAMVVINVASLVLVLILLTRVAKRSFEHRLID